jgi:Na+/H+ antiporter NhaA
VTEERRATAAARTFGTNHPHLFYWCGAGEVIFFVAIGAFLMARSVAGGVIVMVVGLASGSLTALPAIWSERHPEQARAAVAQRRRRQTKLAQQHPAYFLVVVPVFAAIDATLRWNTPHHHRSALSWSIPAAIGLIVGAALGTYLVVRARRSRSTSSSQSAAQA